MRTKEEILGEDPLPIFLLKCKNDFKFFAERCLGVTSYGGIHEFQLSWINAALKYKKLIIESGTGSSKTEVMGAMYPIWRMLTEKNLKILLISKTMEQSSSNMLSRIKRYIEDNELLKQMFTPDDYRSTWNATEIKTKNGHWVKNVPYNDNIRGYRADLIIPDEIDSYENTNIFFEHVLSRLYPQGQVIGISTPVATTRIIGILKEKDKAGLLKGWHFIKTPYLVDEKGNPAKIENRDDIYNYKSIWPEWWTLDKLYDKWGDQGKANWLRNHQCECIGEIDDAVFPIKDIVSSFDYKLGFSNNIHPDAMYFIGVDLAISEGPRADFDAYVVVEKLNGQYIIKSIETYKGLDTIPKINRIEELYKTYYCDNGTYVIVDKSMVGIDVIRGLQSRGVPVLEGSFHSIARKQLYRTLSNVIASKRLVIPRNPEIEDDSVKYSEMLKEQLSGFRRTKSQKTNQEMIESRAAHDDLAAALSLAISEAVQHEEMELCPLVA